MKVAIGLGSNLEDRFYFISNATFRLFTLLEEAESSSIYETAPWGVIDQPAFLNSVVCGKTDLSADALFLKLKETEKVMGRKQRERYGPREIDLDLLICENLFLQTETLTVPHAHLTEREFVLAPLNEVWPDWIHPALERSVASLWEKILRTQPSTSKVFAAPLQNRANQ